MPSAAVQLKCDHCKLHNAVKCIVIMLRFPFAISFLLPAVLLCQIGSAQTVRFHTNLGDIDVAMLPDRPLSVANFLNYMKRGAYDNSVFHRSVKGFIIQGGGFTFKGGNLPNIPQDAAVRNEPGVSNIRGTIAMAKLGSDANSATNQWFFNLADNSSNLNNQNGGFTVFGRITNTAGLAIMDKIAAVPVPSPAILASPFDAMPLINYRGGSITEANLVLVLSMFILGDPPTITSGGVVTASSFGGANVGTAGSFLEIYGTNLAGDISRTWADADFKSGVAPTTLDEVTATVNGIPAFVYYVSKNQVNIQVPTGVPTSGFVPVVVSYRGQASGSSTFQLKSTAAGLLAPPTFKVGDIQYAVAIHATGGKYVSNGNIPNVDAAPAVPGETLTFYGTGFGPVTPSTTVVAGKVVTGLAPITNTLEFKIGGISSTVLYAGLVPGLVGVYQFNVTVPTAVDSGDQPIEVTLNSDVIAQKLFVALK